MHLLKYKNDAIGPNAFVEMMWKHILSEKKTA